MSEIVSSPSRIVPTTPFSAFLSLPDRSLLRRRITASTRTPEPDCLPPLLDLAALPPDKNVEVARLAHELVAGLRRKGRPGGVEGLVHEYSLSSQEGVALMCLAEALLRVPDTATRDALIRDKIATGDWRAHVGHSPSMFVNAATWGLVVTGRLTATTHETGLASALANLIRRGGEPLIRKGVDLAMRMMGEQFVTGQTIEEALGNARRMETKGFAYSYDMLGEAAMTAEDAARYLRDYEHAIHAIGRAGAGRGIIDGPGISIKLSALHPRYSRAKRDRVMAELLPRVKGLALLAKRYDIGINIDAEEADRLELSLDILQALVLDRDLSGWNGIGFVIQAYGKRCPFVIDWLVDLARRSARRLMVRLVKGAYWDTEIKRAQVDGLDGFPVFTRKVYTDVSYLACAKKLLAAADAVYPQFATHNAQTVAAIGIMAGPAYKRGQYEFQCLHGMGESLYEQVVGSERFDRPCRIYAPVGTHETLLAYLVRRLLENGANSSFVNRLADEAVPIADLIADPVAVARSIVPLGAPHEAIALPRDLYGRERRNAAGLDLSNDETLAALATTLRDNAQRSWTAVPTTRLSAGGLEPILNPADHDDVVGFVGNAGPAEIETALAQATSAVAGWAVTPAIDRAACLRKAADAMEAAMPLLIGLAIREAGKSLTNAVAEVREAIDFLRYYANGIVHAKPVSPLGPIVCISPWNFPLAIFTGQVAAALAAGNTVLAKPAEEAPLIAAAAVRILHEAGVPADVLHLVTGAGEVGAALVGDARVQGVMFTGSTDVARSIQAQLSGRLANDGHPVPLIAETGGQNAMIVDSSAMPEQVVDDVIASAFDSAGQRCSALRILCLQDDIADRVLTLLKGAMAELEIGNPDRLSVDVGPVISETARTGIEAHIATMRERGHVVHRLPLPSETRHGTFVAPTIIEIAAIAEVEREIFGPVLHILRYRRDGLDEVIDAINATGYGLTFGLHTRIDETIAHVTARIRAGNIYVNRNMIGAVVGVQPFGGSGLSGTGPKAGGPLYLGRLRRGGSSISVMGESRAPAVARDYRDWLLVQGRTAAASRCTAFLTRSLVGLTIDMPGPVGERNVYGLRPLGRVAALSTTEDGLLVQIGAILSTGNTAIVDTDHPYRSILGLLPTNVVARVLIASAWQTAGVRALLFEGDRAAVIALNATIATLPGPIRSLQITMNADATSDATDGVLDRLFEEWSVSTNTAAAGGNASLVAIA